MAEPLLERSTWDFIPDANGDLAMVDAPYAIAQQVACECQMYLGEGWFDTAQGIPYDPDILGQAPNIALLQSLMETAALGVPGVVSARAVLYLSRAARTVKGAIYVTTDSGVDLSVGL